METLRRCYMGIRQPTSGHSSTSVTTRLSSTVRTFGTTSGGSSGCSRAGSVVPISLTYNGKRCEEGPEGIPLVSTLKAVRGPRLNVEYGWEYRYGPLNEPPSLSEPAAILSADLSIDPRQLIHRCCCVVSAVEKIWARIPNSPPNICGFHRKAERHPARFQTRDARGFPGWGRLLTIFLWGVYLD